MLLASLSPLIGGALTCTLSLPPFLSLHHVYVVTHAHADVVTEGDETADEGEGDEAVSPQEEEGEGLDFAGVSSSPQTSVSLLRKCRPSLKARLAAAADKAERLGGCAERAQYGAPLCTIS